MTPDIEKERKEAKKYYDKQAQPSSVTPQEFRPEQLISVQDENTKEWTKRGRIIERVAPRPYTIILLNGRVILRNSKTIRKLYAVVSVPNRSRVPQVQLPINTPNSPSPSIPEDSDEDTIPYNDEIEEEVKRETEETTITTRYGRVICIKRPIDYDDS
jgi:hypothetical protein